MRTLKTGDPCPCCGMPIKSTDPDKLRMLAMLADFMELPVREPDERKDGENERVSEN